MVWVLGDSHLFVLEQNFLVYDVGLGGVVGPHLLQFCLQALQGVRVVMGVLVHAALGPLVVVIVVGIF